jgi:ATP-dependent Clp protease adaptor protein ClpS
MFDSPRPWEEEDEVALMDEETDEGYDLLVYNDEVNSFEWVIECFRKVLGFTFEQSEQLSIIIHYKGKAAVKHGSLDTLTPLATALLERGLSVKIE